MNEVVFQDILDAAEEDLLWSELPNEYENTDMVIDPLDFSDNANFDDDASDLFTAHDYADFTGTD